MRRVKYQPYLFLIGFLLLLLSFPERAQESMRYVAISSLSPSWHGLERLKGSLLHLLMIPLPGSHAADIQSNYEIEQLKQENLRLRTELIQVREWLLHAERVQEQIDYWKTLHPMQEPDASLAEFYKRKEAHLAFLLEHELLSLPARVVFREPVSWSSRLWINVGERDNQKVKRKIISKNSPVMVGTALVGVVEYVGATQSRVRLISDSELAPSVRAQRGREQNEFLVEQLEMLTIGLQEKDELFHSKAEMDTVMKFFHGLKARLKLEAKEESLAKGELHGNSQPLWRCPSRTLSGVGFNYDYSDESGEARDLRSGQTLAALKKGESQPLLRAGDLLVTTGMDGIFPPGFRVAVVSKVGVLKEGACSYDLEAKALAGNLDELKQVRVLPALGFDRKSID